MIGIFEHFLSDLFKDAFPFVDIMFDMIIKIVFNIENNLFDGSIFDNNMSENSEAVQQATIGFNSLFAITTKIGIALCTFKLLKKIFDTYIVGTDGDNSVSAERMLLGYIKALIIIFSFSGFYDILVKITLEFTDDILNGIGFAIRPNMMTSILNIFIGKGLFKMLGLLIFFIAYLILIFQFITRGLEMFILRLGIPLAVTGLIDSDNGVFAPYVKIFIQNSITVVIQVGMLKLALNVMANLNMFFGIASIFMAIKTPKFLQQFMVGGGGGINIHHISSTIRNFRSIYKK